MLFRRRWSISRLPGHRLSHLFLPSQFPLLARLTSLGRYIRTFTHASPCCKRINLSPTLLLPPFPHLSPPQGAKYGCCVPAIAEIMKGFGSPSAETWILDFFKNSGVVLPPKCNPNAIVSTATVKIAAVPCEFIKANMEGVNRCVIV